MDGATKDILRYVILLAAAPIWVPFLRMLWRDFNEALRPEGGLLGHALSPREKERLEREKPLESHLVSEEIVTPETRRETRLRAPSTAPLRMAGGPQVPAKAAVRPAGRMGPRPRRSGFRS